MQAERGNGLSPNGKRDLKELSRDLVQRNLHSLSHRAERGSYRGKCDVESDNRTDHVDAVIIVLGLRQISVRDVREGNPRRDAIGGVEVVANTGPDNEIECEVLPLADRGQVVRHLVWLLRVGVSHTSAQLEVGYHSPIGLDEVVAKAHNTRDVAGFRSFGDYSIGPADGEVGGAAQDRGATYAVQVPSQGEIERHQGIVWNPWLARELLSDDRLEDEWRVVPKPSGIEANFELVLIVNLAIEVRLIGGRYLLICPIVTLILSSARLGEDERGEHRYQSKADKSCFHA